MRLIISVLLLGWAVFAPITSFGQEAAGRVLAVAGDVTIERGAQRIAARPLTEVRAGDTFQLGAQSNAQVRFSDDSVVALGSDTTFRVSEYAFQGRAPEAQSAFFNLIKGGMRTVTGLIGRANRDNYGLRTATATIGIRGTAYAACQDCVTVRGEALPGTSVGFTEGAGTIRTQGGELQLAAGESAYAPNATANPVRTLSFPRTQQEARARPSASQQAQAAQKGGAATTASSATTAAQSGDSGGGVLTSTNLNAPLAQVTTQPVFQVTSTPNPETILAPSFTGTTFYRLEGPFNIPTSCTNPPCSTAVAGEFTLAVNFALQRATASVNMKFADGGIINAGSPISSSGFPISIIGGQPTFSATFNLADFPLNRGAFACSDCGPGNSPGFMEQITVSGTINGSQATVTFGGTDQGGSGSVTATLTQRDPPNNFAAAIVTPRLTAGSTNVNNFQGADARSAAYFNVQLDSSGRLLQFGPNVGGPAASVGTATNTIVGTAPAAGNLVWGTWSNGGATITDSNYNTFTSGPPSSLSITAIQPWITGEASNTLPPSLGTLTFTPVGSLFSNPAAHLNSASLTADFVNRSLSLSINASAPPGTGGTNVYQMNATTGFSPTNGRFSAGFNTVTCSGPCNSGVGTPSAAFGGFFSGAQAQGAGVAFTAGFGAGNPNGTGNGLNGVVALKR
jgi:hypothetical protein